MRYGGMIKDESMRMRNQVEKILQMAVLEEGNSEFSLKPMHLHEVIEKAAANFKLQAESKHGSVTLKLEAERDEINADETHLPNVINNILDNALKYSEDHIEIMVATSIHDNCIRLTVADKGIGLSADDLKSVFDKYYRVSSGNVHNAKGFGLGLTYVKLIVEAHRGTVALNSEPGKGTTVTVDLPLATDTERTNG
jgi:two-component system phosphate regulon sensor histidine kinase PhoR